MSTTYAIVIPRYLPEMVGGAEMLLKGYALQLAERGYTIEILTTTTQHIYPWENHFPEGVTEEDRQSAYSLPFANFNRHMCIFTIMGFIIR